MAQGDLETRLVLHSLSKQPPRRAETDRIGLLVAPNVVTSTHLPTGQMYWVLFQLIHAHVRPTLVESRSTDKELAGSFC